MTSAIDRDMILIMELIGCRSTCLSTQKRCWYATRLPLSSAEHEYHADLGESKQRC